MTYSAADMRCEATADLQTFWERTADFLLSDPVVHNVLVTNIAARRTGATSDPAPGMYVAVVDEAGAVVVAAMRTPPFNIYLPTPTSPTRPRTRSTSRSTVRFATLRCITSR